MNNDVARFDRWAATYDRSLLQKWLFRPVQAKMLDLVAQADPEDPPRCIIDVGCGTGRLLRAAAARWPQAQLSGVDPAKGMVEQAKRLNPKAEFKLGTAEALPFPDQTADLVLTSLSFHHWSNQAKGIGEIARVLRRGGRFCLADPTFPLARLFGENVISRNRRHALITAAGLDIHRERRARFMLVTLSQKPL